MTVRVRFAPSPTGFLHVGNVRTALFNWLWARHHKGSFILRIEDTDIERSRPEYEQQLMDDLRWLGLGWDEGVDRTGPFGPYRQSDRYGIYQDYARRLLDLDRVFYCFCSEEELEQVRQGQLAAGRMPLYSGRCRNLPRAEGEARRAAGEKPALRLRVRPGTAGYDDLVYGRIDIDTAQISDPVLMRSDGSPTYNFSCVVDDMLMQITHVIRGEGHLSNTHRQVLIYEALGAPMPRFAHLSTVLGPDGQKLSKRHGATSLEEFRAQGYLAGALVNYLALLGWSPPVEGKEVMARQEIVELFDLARVSKAPAIFDGAKLNWMNRTYIGMTPSEVLLPQAEPFFISAGMLPVQPDARIRGWLAQAIDAVKTHVDHLDQLPQQASIIFAFASDPPEIEAEAKQILSTPEASSVAREFLRLVEEQEIVDADRYRTIAAQVRASTSQKGKNLYHPIRAALTGAASGPELERLVPLYEEGSRLPLPRRIMSCRERIRAVLAALG
jgi:nondiscriminating glutamyl-tRNA synthetase